VPDEPNISDIADERSVAQFLDALGSNAPTPGGGAACAVAGAMAAALAEMVAQFTVGKPAYAADDASMRAMIERAQHLRQVLLQLVTEDERGFAAVSAAYRLPKATEAERTARTEAIQAALQVAMQPPLQVMKYGCEVAVLALAAAEAGNTSLASDAGCAALFAEAAVRAAGLNVLANVVLMRDTAAAERLRRQVASYEQQAAGLREQTMRHVNGHLGR